MPKKIASFNFAAVSLGDSGNLLCQSLKAIPRDKDYEQAGQYA
jgi:hypothetical protein